MKATAEEQTNITPKEDLMNEALRHYEIISEAESWHRSDIPKAIREYYSEPAEGAEEFIRAKYCMPKELPNELCFFHEKLFALMEAYAAQRVAERTNKILAMYVPDGNPQVWRDEIIKLKGKSK